MISRRSTLSVIPFTAGIIMSAGARAAGEEPSPERHTLGQEDAPVTIQEFFSYTCPHCAHFEKEVFPEIRAALIDTGKARWVFREYPLDGLALMVSALAWNLPQDKYYAFMHGMLLSQNSWTTADQVQARKNLETRAALAGIPASTVTEVFAENSALRHAVIEERIRGNKTYGVDSTPSFIMNRAGNPKYEKRSNMTATEFIKWVEA